MEWVKETVITTAVSKISRFNQVVTISKTSTSGPRMNEIRRVSQQQVALRKRGQN